MHAAEPPAECLVENMHHPIMLCGDCPAAAAAVCPSRVWLSAQTSNEPFT